MVPYKNNCSETNLLINGTIVSCPSKVERNQFQKELTQKKTSHIFNSETYYLKLTLVLEKRMILCRDISFTASQ